MEIALVQANLSWEDNDKNLAHFSSLLENVTGVDLFILPEMFNSGFTMNSDNVGQTMEGKAIFWLQKMANEKDAVFVASLVILENNKRYNRLVWATPNGDTKTYNKKHLFRMANEHNHFTPGNERVIIEYKGMRFCPQICYDLRFPIWSRNSDGQSKLPIYDCLIYVANWPKVRSDAWTSLLKARAIENQAFVVGVNRVGLDGNGIEYSGDSRLYSPKGQRLDKVISGKEMINIVTINLDILSEFRKNFPVSDDGDLFTIV
jgi:omega-amidase